MIDNIIIGAGGQDGIILKNLIENKGESVVAVFKSYYTTKNLKKPFSIFSQNDVEGLITNFLPRKIFYLAGYHHSSEDNFEDDVTIFRKSIDVHLNGLINFLETLVKLKLNTKVFFASSSHVFGDIKSSPQNENSPMNPVSAYGISKLAGMNACNFYRDQYKLNISSGIFYNHESVYRESKFVSSKIVEAAVKIKCGMQEKLILGNINSPVDWGSAEDYMDAVLRISNLEKPYDFIISSGQRHTVKDFIDYAFCAVSLDWKKYVEVNPEILKGNVHSSLFGDYSFLHKMTGWEPSKSLKEIAEEMVRSKLLELSK